MARVINSGPPLLPDRLNQTIKDWTSLVNPIDAGPQGHQRRFQVLFLKSGCESLTVYWDGQRQIPGLRIAEETPVDQLIK